MKNLNLVFTPKQVNELTSAQENGCAIANIIVNFQKENRVPNPDEVSLLRGADVKGLNTVIKKVLAAYDAFISGYKAENIKDELKLFSKELDYLPNVRKVLKLDIKARTKDGQTNQNILSYLPEAMRTTEKTIDEHYKTLPIEIVSKRAILATDENMKPVLFFEKGIFSLIGTLDFKEVINLVANKSRYSKALVQKMYIKFNKLSAAKQVDCYFQAANVNNVLNESEFEGLNRERFEALCELFEFKASDKDRFKKLAALKNKKVAIIMLELYPYQFDKYSSLRELWADKKGEEPGTSFKNYVVDTLNFANIEAFNLAITEATPEMLLSDIKAAIFDAKVPEVKETTQIDKTAKVEADKLAQEREDKEAQERENKLAELLEQRTKCIEQREKLEKSKAKNVAEKLTALDTREAKIQEQLNDLQGLNAPLNPAKVYQA